MDVCRSLCGRGLRHCLEGRGESCSSPDGVLRRQLHGCPVCRYRDLQCRRQNVGKRCGASMPVVLYNLCGTVTKHAVYSSTVRDTVACTVVVAVGRLCGGLHLIIDGRYTLFSLGFLFEDEGLIPFSTPLRIFGPPEE